MAKKLQAGSGIGCNGGERLVEFVGEQGCQLVGGLQALQAGSLFQRFPCPVFGLVLFRDIDSGAENQLDISIIIPKR